MKYMSRLYQKSSDYEEIKNLIKEIISIKGTPFHGGVGDFEFWANILSEKDDLLKSRLYFNAEDKLVGFFWPADSSFDLFIHPNYQEVFSQILAEYQPDSNISKISCGAFSDNAYKQKILKENNFKALNQYSIHYEYNLSDFEIKPLDLDQNNKILSLSSLKTINSKIECYKGCFPDHQLSKDKYLSLMECSSYKPDFDLVLVNQDEKVLSFATIWLDTKNSIGVFEPIGTDKEVRGKGLAKLIMTAGLNKLKKNKIEKAYLKTGHKNYAAQTVYEKLGFKAIAREYSWERDLN